MKWIVALCLLTGAAQAAETATSVDSTSSARFDWGRAFSKVGLSYGGLLLGPSLQSMEGNLDGRGTNISLRNYFSADVEVARDWEVQAGWELRRYWRPADPKNPNRSDFDPRDPYLGLSRRNLIRAGAFSLGAKARYFIPVSNYTKAQVGKTYDSGRGALNVSAYPYLRLLDGDLGISCTAEFWYNFDKAAAANRENYSVKAKPLVSYRFARKFAAKVEYNTGTIRHAQNGKWSKLNDKFLGQKLYAGITYYPNPSLSLNPSLGWGSDTFRLNRAEVSLFASYSFL
jgi:hypothetical protein